MTLRSSEFPSNLRIGLLGGSFNPAHAGHRAIAEVALKQLGLHRVVWLVSPQNPLKAQNGMADFEARYASARALANHPRMTVSAFEEREGTRYTVDTIRRLKQRHPQTHFVFLIGADNLIQLPRWQGWTDIFETVPIAVFARPGWTFAPLFAKAAQRYARARRPLTAARGLALSHAPAWVFVPYTRRYESGTAIRLRGDWVGANLPS